MCIHKAAENGHLDIVQYLIGQCGVALNVKGSVSGLDCVVVCMLLS